MSTMFYGSMIHKGIVEHDGTMRNVGHLGILNLLVMKGTNQYKLWGVKWGEELILQNFDLRLDRVLGKKLQKLFSQTVLWWWFTRVFCKERYTYSLKLTLTDIAPENRPSLPQKERLELSFNFQPSIFQMRELLVSGRVINLEVLHHQLICLEKWWNQKTSQPQ